MALELALYQPEIPPNTGNIIRLCANTGLTLHLIGPLGFVLDDKRVQRAGLDYHELANVVQHVDFAAFQASLSDQRVLACTTKARINYCDHQFTPHDILLMGPESRGLPAEILAWCGETQCLRIPMRAGSRSLNLSNATAVLVYEALRQLAFPNLV